MIVKDSYIVASNPVGWIKPYELLHRTSSSVSGYCCMPSDFDKVKASVSSTDPALLFDRRYDEKFDDMDKEMAELKNRLIKLENMYNQLAEQFDITGEEIILRDISLEEAKNEITQYFKKHDGEEIGYEELIEDLRLDPKLVVHACSELEEEGKIG